MYKKVITLSVLFILVCGCPSLAADQVQNAVISADTDHWNIQLSLAAAGNGSVLSVWSERRSDTNAIASIRAVLATRGANGTYTFAPQRLISSGNRFEDHAAVAWHAPTNTWFVTWFTIPEAPLVCLPMTLHVRRLAQDGSPVGDTVTVISDGTKNVSPRLRYIDGGPHKGRFVICWVQRGLDTGSPASLRAMIVDVEGAIYAGPYEFRHVTTPGETRGMYPGYIEDIVTNTDGAILVGYTATRQEEPFIVDARIARLNADALFQNDFLISGPGDHVRVRLIRLKTNAFIANWFQANTETITTFTRKFNSAAAPIGKVMDVFPNRKEVYSDLVRLGADKGAYQVSVISGVFYGRYLKKNGSPKGAERAIATGAGALDEMRACAVPGTNQVFVLWTKRLSNLTKDVRALVFTAK